MMNLELSEEQNNMADYKTLEDIFNDDLTKWRIITRSLNMQLETIRKAAEGIEELFNK